MTEPPLVGIFVGGRGTRMGGAAKGLLPAPGGGRLIERLISTVEEAAAALQATLPIVLVGNAEAYSTLGLPALADAPAGIGPLGGLAALLARATAEQHEAAVALSCDLPFITRQLVVRLITEQTGALALAPRVETRWSPLTARYSVAALSAVKDSIAAGERSLQSVFARLGARCGELATSESERAALIDWDRPEDIRR